MKVVILCGGKGTRLREETEYRPKPMVPIGENPVLWHIMKYYAHFGFHEFVLCLGYKGDQIKYYFRNYLWNVSDVTITLGRNPDLIFHDRHDEENWKVTLAETGQNSLTARRILNIQKYIPVNECFMLTYGDGLSDIDLNALIQCHRMSGKICTLSAVHPAGRFGSLTIKADGDIHRFAEKPQVDDTYVNGGFMVCDYRIFDYLARYNNVMLEREPMEELVRDGQLNSYRHEGWWQPMDNYRETIYLNELWHGGQAPWHVWKG